MGFQLKLTLFGSDVLLLNVFDQFFSAFSDEFYDVYSVAYYDTGTP